MRVEGRTLDLRQQELAVQQQLAAIRSQRAQNIIDALQFNVDKAGATASVNDDVAALLKLQAALRHRIRVEGRTLDLQRQAFDVQQQLIQARTAQRQARQMAALGFDPSGSPLVKTAKGLRKELAQVVASIGGTELDTGLNRALIARIRKVLTGRFGKLTKDVRDKIQQLLDDLIGQLKQVKDSADKAAQSLTKLDALKMFADLRQFGGNVWTRVPAMAAPVPGAPPMPATGVGVPITPGGRAGREQQMAATKPHVTVVQNFKAPTPDRHREARYAQHAARAVFDGTS
jgi:hypothetical protein